MLLSPTIKASLLTMPVCTLFEAQLEQGGATVIPGFSKPYLNPSSATSHVSLGDQIMSEPQFTFQ